MFGRAHGAWDRHVANDFHGHCLDSGFTIPRLRSCVGNRAVGALRVSLGVPTTVGDLDRFTEFVRRLAA